MRFRWADCARAAPVKMKLVKGFEFKIFDYLSSPSTKNFQSSPIELKYSFTSALSECFYSKFDSFITAAMYPNLIGLVLSCL